jgi:hypothetical protein
MRITLIIIFSIYLHSASGLVNDFRYPEIKSFGKAIADFIPQGWQVVDTAYGDLNKDTVNDLAIVIENKANDIGGQIVSGSLGQRMLIVLFRTESKYVVKVCADTAILRSDEGGMGDPYVDLKIANGCLVLYFSGGSSEKWFLTYRFRFQNNDFFLIGATLTYLHFEESKSGEIITNSICYDYNLSTSILETIAQGGKNSKNRSNKKQKMKPISLPRLNTFAPWHLVIDEKNGIVF